MTTIIQDFPVWLPSQRLSFEASGSPQTTHSVSPHLTHSTPHRLRHRVGRASMYESEHSGCGIYLCFVHLSRYEVIILERHLVTRSEQSVGRNQTSSLVKLSASSSVLVRVLARWRGSTFGMLSILVRALARWQRYTFGMSSVLVRVLARWRRSDTSKPSVLARVLARWLGSWRVTRDDRTWRMYTSGTVLEWLRARRRTVWAPDTRSAKDSLIHRKYRHESDDEDLGWWCMKSGGWWMKSRVHLWSEY